MEKKLVTLKSAEELKEISADKIILDAALFAHRKTLKYIIDTLTEELKITDAAILEKVNHEKVKTALFYTVISDYNEFNKEEFIEKYGQKAYNDLKTKPVHRESVRS